MSSAGDESTVAPAGSRREGRERVLGLLYEAESKGIALTDLVDDPPLPLTGYAKQITGDLAASMDDIAAGLAAYVEAGATELRVGGVPSVGAETRLALADWLR